VCVCVCVYVLRADRKLHCLYWQRMSAGNVLFFTICQTFLKEIRALAWLASLTLPKLFTRGWRRRVRCNFYSSATASDV